MHKKVQRATSGDAQRTRAGMMPIGLLLHIISRQYKRHAFLLCKSRYTSGTKALTAELRVG